MSTHNICFCGEIRIVLVFLVEKKYLIWSCDLFFADCMSYSCHVSSIQSFHVIVTVFVFCHRLNFCSIGCILFPHFGGSVMQMSAFEHGQNVQI